MGAGQHEPALPAVPRQQLVEHPQREQPVLVAVVIAQAQQHLGVAGEPRDALWRGGRRRDAMVDAERDHTGPFELDELLVERLATRVLREEQHPIGDGERRACQLAISLPRGA